MKTISKEKIDLIRKGTKDLHDIDKFGIGTSDISELVVIGEGVYPEGTKMNDSLANLIDFDEDATYYAREVGEDTLVPDYYELVGVYPYWVKIYDDSGLCARYKGGVSIFKSGKTLLIKKLQEDIAESIKE